MASIRIASSRGYSLAALLVAGACLAACATPQPRLATRIPEARPAAKPPSTAAGRQKVGKPYQVGGIWYVPKEDPDYDVRGVASWYGNQFHRRPTANGEIFDMYAVSAAHTTLPLPSIVEVTNLENGRSLKVRVNDRGPFVGNRVIDLSHEAARQLGFDRKGLAKVRVRYVGPAPLKGAGSARRAEADEAPVAPVGSIAPPPVAQMRTESPYGPYAAYADEVWTAPQAPVVSQSALPPAAASGGIQTAQAPLPPARVTIAAPSPSSLYRIQAGAFGDPANAQRALDTLSGAGADGVIEAVDRDGATLYRVMIQAANDEAKAFELRELVAGYGFFDARVIGPY